jgi:hypothetical protein
MLKGAISVNIYYLMVKTHNITGLKYLCQTKKKDPYKYLGSGIEWTKHLKIHGLSIHTEIILTTTDKQELGTVGRYYSNVWRITSAMDDFGNKIWANLIPETAGGQGLFLEKSKQKLKDSWSDPETKIKRSKAIRDSLNSPESKKKMSDKQIIIKNDPFYKEKNKKMTTDSWKDPSIREKRISRLRITCSTIEFKQKMSKVTSGKNNPCFDHTVYKWVHTSGLQETLTRYDLIKKYNLSKVIICRIIKGKTISNKGWKLLK